jgi:transaldolase
LTVRGRPAIFLDRDGVLNEVTVRDGIPVPPPGVAQLRLLPGVVAACRRLRELGFVLVVVTNQPDIARGVRSRAAVDRIHARLGEQLPLDEVVVCPHDDADGCGCRKPRPGMILAAAGRLGLDLSRSFCVGDRWRDIEAARRAGVGAIYVDRRYGERRPDRVDAIVDGLPDAVSFIESRLAERAGPIRRSNRSMAGTTAFKHVQVYADGGDLESVVALAEWPEIAGFTTNPTLMRKAGIDDYEAFARKLVAAIPDRPISFGVLADEPDEMVRQAHVIAGWGPNVYVKVPVTNTRGDSTEPVVRQLTADQVQLNVTALMTVEQVRRVTAALSGSRGAIVSVFAGRIADTGRDPVPLMTAALRITSAEPNVRLLWASPREILNVWQADDIGVDIVTVTHDLLPKLRLYGKALDDYSLETVRMFHDDARDAGYVL